MTYFRDELIQQALKLIHELKELEDVLNDISRAENAYNEICNAAYNFIVLRIESAQLFYEQSLQRATDIDHKLRKKYKGIEEMVKIASMIPPIPSTNKTTATVSKCSEQIHLEQDYFGILFDTLKKKAEIKCVEDFIDHVEA